MGEYIRKQRNQFNAVTNYRESKNSQLKGFVDNRAQTVSQTELIASTQKKPNNTGLHDNLKSGIENQSNYCLDSVKVHQNVLVMDSKLQVMNMFGSSIKPIQRLANKHGLTLAQYRKNAGFVTYGWGRLTGPAITTDLNPVTSTGTGHAEDHLIAQANAEIANAAVGAIIPVTPAVAAATGNAAAATIYTNLEIWISSSPCSTAFGTRAISPTVLQGCLEKLSTFAAINGMIVNVHAQKPYQPSGVGMKRNSVNAAGSDPNVPHDFDNRTGIAMHLTAYVAPPAFAAIGLGTVAQLSSNKEDDEREQLHTEKGKRTEGKVIVTFE